MTVDLSIISGSDAAKFLLDVWNDWIDQLRTSVAGSTNSLWRFPPRRLLESLPVWLSTVSTLPVLLSRSTICKAGSATGMLRVLIQL